MNINLVGAFDRNNYGDLLFPLIVQGMLDKINEEQKLKQQFNYNYIGLRESDLSEFGGVVTNPLSFLNKEKNSITILVGGEILGTNFLGMHLCFERNFFSKIILRSINKFGGKRVINNYLKNKYQTKQDHPWIPSVDFMLKNKVIFNSVGGSNINPDNKDLIHSVNQSLMHSSFYSVRDQKTFQLLENVNSITKEKVVVSPDSAVIMSDLYPENELTKLISTETKNYMNRNRNYVIFQVSQKIAKGIEREIAEKLDMLSNSLDVEIVLLPIGRAPEHDDQKALNKISKYMQSHYYLPEQNSIFDTMNLICNSKLYIGTSLHGAITAISYNIPHVAFTDKITKLNEFLITWGTTTINNTDIDSLINDSKSLISHPKDISNVIDKMKGEVKNNFYEIYKII